MKKISRREFLAKSAIIGGSGLIMPSLLPLLGQAEDEAPKEKEKEIPLNKIIAVCAGQDPAAITKGVLEILGGMKKFVKKDDIVLVKPNIAWEKKPEFAATTNPDVVATIIKEARAAGAKKVKVLDRTCNDARRCYHISGIEEAAKKAGAEVILIEKASQYKEVEIKKGQVLKTATIVKEALECDVFINVPIAKHHGLTKLTLGIKNLMGLLGGKRADLHKDIDKKLADILTVLKPHLTIIDAFRVLIKHGPTGGKKEDVRLVGQVMAGVDIVAVDAYSSGLEAFKETLGDIDPDDIDYIKTAAERELGEIDLKKMQVIEKKL